MPREQAQGGYNLAAVQDNGSTIFLREPLARSASEWIPWTLLEIHSLALRACICHITNLRIAMSNVHIIDHPLVNHHLIRLRDQTTKSSEFRRLVRRLATLLAYQATHDLSTESAEVQTPVAVAHGERLAQRIAIVPILRAGLGMVDPIQELIPEAEVWHLGLYRNEATAEPVEYYNKLPRDGLIDVALIVDPMLATGGSASLALEKLQEIGVTKSKLVSIICSQPGIDAVLAHFPEVQIYTCAVDDELNSQKFIVPGLGDAGDRIFNT